MMAKRYVLPLIFLILFLPISFSSHSYAQKDPTMEEKILEGISEVKTDIAVLKKGQEDLKESLNKRIDDTNKRIDDLQFYFNLMIAILVIIVGSIIGLYRRLSKIEGILEERKEVEIKEVRFEKQEKEIEELREIVKGLQAKIASS